MRYRKKRGAKKGRKGCRKSERKDKIKAKGEIGAQWHSRCKTLIIFGSGLYKGCMENKLAVDPRVI